MPSQVLHGWRLCVSGGKVISSDPHAKLVTQKCCDLLRRGFFTPIFRGSLSHTGNFDIIRHISVC